MRRLALLLAAALLALPSAAKPEVWYVPGWLRCGGADPIAWSALTNAFTEAKAVYVDWDGNHGWGRSVTNADAAVEMLAARLAALPEPARMNLTLVGHSLGGRIVVRTLARLADRNLTVGQGVALAAAMPADDPALATAGAASVRPLVLMGNPRDFTLKCAYRAARGVHGPALGLVGPAGAHANVRAVSVPAEITRETEVAAAWGRVELFKKLAAHHAVFYLNELRKRKEEVLK